MMSGCLPHHTSPAAVGFHVLLYGWLKYTGISKEGPRMCLLPAELTDTDYPLYSIGTGWEVDSSACRDILITFHNSILIKNPFISRRAYYCH